MPVRCLALRRFPVNNQIRNLLDPLMPSHLDGVYLEVFEGLEQHGVLASFRGLDDQLLVALDGTSTIPPRRCIATTVSGVTPQRAKPSTIIAPLPQ